MLDRIKSLFGMGAWLGAISVVILFCTSGIANAACFTADEAQRQVEAAGGYLVFQSKRPAAVQVAQSLVAPIAADEVRVYSAPDSEAAAVVFLSKGCLLSEDGVPATHENAVMYLISVQQAAYLIEAMAEADKKSKV